MKAKLITGDQYLNAVCDALGFGAMPVCRIIVDATVGEGVMVYVELFGSEELLHIALPSGDGLEVEIVPRDSAWRGPAE